MLVLTDENAGPSGGGGGTMLLCSRTKSKQATEPSIRIPHMWSHPLPMETKRSVTKVSASPELFLPQQESVPSVRSPHA